MAAGLGFKDFVTGEVLTAADVDGYLMQGVWVFASAAARDAAVTSPQEGNFAYLKDTNVTTYYTGSAWANLDTTGMTNPMTTTGDTIYSSSGSTPARLGIGTAGQVLKVNAGATAPEWGSAGGATGLTLVKTQTVGSGVSSVTVSDAFSSTYGNYLITSSGILASQNQNSSLQFGTTTTGYYYFGTIGVFSSSTVSGSNGNNASSFGNVLAHTTTSSNMLFHAHAPYLSTATVVNWRGSQVTTDGNSYQYQGFLNNTTSYTAFKLTPGDGTLTGGTISVYGYNL